LPAVPRAAGARPALYMLMPARIPSIGDEPRTERASGTGDPLAPALGGGKQSFGGNYQAPRPTAPTFTVNRRRPSPNELPIPSTSVRVFSSYPNSVPSACDLELHGLCPCERHAR